MAVEDPALRASLYVGDLHPEVTENDLFEAFGRIGPLLSVHLCRDKFSRKSLCYGYVNFWFRCHASTALKCLNHMRLRGKSVRIMWCQRNPIARESTVGNLFVKNLDQSITGARLQEIFSKYGTILSCKVAEDKGISQGFGFVQFDSEESALAALNSLHCTMLEGKKLYVSKFLKKAERDDAGTRFRNLYVKNLDDGVTADLLKDKFSEYGKVLGVVIMKDEKGKPKGFGFVHFDSHEGAKKAMEALNGELLGSSKLFVSWAQRRDATMQRSCRVNGYKCGELNNQATKGLNLFVKNLSPSVDDRRLKELFSHYGKVGSAKVIRNGDGTSKKYGFVHFLCPEDAHRALNSLIGTSFEGRALHVALARRKEQQTSSPQNYCAEFQSPSLHWNSPCFNSGMVVIQLNQWHPAFYQNSATSVGSISPFPAEDFSIFSKLQQLSKSKNGVKTSFSEMPCSVAWEVGPGYVCHPFLQNLQLGFVANCLGLQLETEKCGSKKLLKQDPCEEIK